DAVVQQRPRRVLARGAAAEVAPGYHDAAALRFRPVEREGRVVAAVRQVAPVLEAVLAQACARGGGEEARRDDAVGVDVLVRQHGSAGVDAHQKISEGQIPFSPAGKRWPEGPDEGRVLAMSKPFAFASSPLRGED